MPAAKNTGPDTPGFFPWEQRHTDILAAGIIELVNQHKHELYRLAGLAGEVDGHGSDRINSKVKQMMRKFAMDNHLDPALAQGKGGKGGKKGTNGEERKRKNDEVQGGVKKARPE